MENWIFIHMLSEQSKDQSQSLLKKFLRAGPYVIKMAERRKRNVDRFIRKPERSRLEKSVFRKHPLLFASPDHDLSRSNLWPG
jgi:hypothetical protein